MANLLARARRQAARLRSVRTAGRFARAEDGATAVEFALVSIPFLMLVFGIIELGLVYMVSLTLENAVIDVGRTIRTGQVQTTSGSTATGFKSAVCAKMNWLGASKCNAALQIDVRTFADYASTNASSSNTIVPTTMSWDPGTPGSIVLVRAYYTWPLITPLMKTGTVSSNGKQIIYAATAFNNEPYNQ